MKIEILKKGPYKVSGNVPLKNALIIADEDGISTEWGKGKEFETPKSGEYFLCRCGRSKTKPYCDGAHIHCNFRSDEVPQISREKVYKGAKVDIVDDEQYCASMRFCDRGPRAWTAAVHSDKPGYEELAIKECADCAAGRLTIRRKDGTLIEPDLPKEISPIQDVSNNFQGPLWVKGGIELTGSDGRPYKVRNRLTLCRCGESRNMPFCDISHLSCPHMFGVDEGTDEE